MLIKILQNILVFVIKLYQWTISPLFPSKCRYIPTCSQYTIEAINKHGIIQGSFFGVKRICRCHPYGGSGYDPVK